MVDGFNEISDRLEEDRHEHALALKRIDALEREVFDCKDDIVAISKDHQRGLKLFNYLESHDGITTTTAMKLLDVSHHQPVLRAMKWCAENDDRFFYTKTPAGKRILKVKWEE